MTTGSARVLLAGLVDYAGLFPPAALGMEAAVAEYARWREAPEAFMLGRFVAPAARLAELARAAGPRLPAAGAGEPWRVSALVAADPQADAAAIAAFNAAHAARARVDAIELKAASPGEADAALDAAPAGLRAYVELPLEAPLEDALALLRRRGARAKVRTGGVVPAAIPDPRELARFVAACAAAGVAFKATAGLHHALRGEHALGYDAASPRATMHGFLNLFAAAAFARAGVGAAELEAVLREEDASAFRVDDQGLGWRELFVTTEALAAARSGFAASFGSCSFAEPVADLQGLGILAASPQATTRGHA